MKIQTVKITKLKLCKSSLITINSIIIFALNVVRILLIKIIGTHGT